MKINKKELALAILLPLAVGGLSALLSGGMDLYSRINKPALAPPGILFPIVWAILYILMGISSYLVYQSDNPAKENALNTYLLQLAFNFFWSIFFFRFEWYLFSFFWLLAMIALILSMIVQFWRIKPLSGALQLPYLLWCAFAAYLNYMIYILN